MIISFTALVLHETTDVHCWNTVYTFFDSDDFAPVGNVAYDDDGDVPGAQCYRLEAWNARRRNRQYKFWAALS